MVLTWFLSPFLVLVVPVTDGSGLLAITNLPQTITVPEDTPPWAPIFTVKMPGMTPRMTYTMTPDTNFSINALGQVQFSAPLDYDLLPKAPTFTLTISVTSKTKKTTFTGTLTVVVTNVFDVPPNLTSNTSVVTVKEELLHQTLSCYVAAVDAETGDGDKLTFSLSGPNSMFFAIDGTTGAISVQNPIDYEAGYHTLSLVVWVEDLGGNKDRLDITVNVEDVNDNAPTCSPNTVHVAVPEDAADNTVVASLFCTDVDSVTTTTLSCKIVSGDPSSNFTTDTPGTSLLVKTAGPLDHETTPSYTLIVHVYDNDTEPSRHTAVVTVVVQVQDVDDNAPVWVTLAQTIPVSEDVVPGSTFFTVLAIDPDTTPGSTVTYVVTGGTGMHSFKINSFTGELSTLVTLDCDNITKSYDLVLNASDGQHNTPSLSLTITLLDVNDNTPEFNDASYTYSVIEDAILSTSVGTVSATDSDAGQNGIFFFSLDVFLQGTPSHFTIDHNTGVVSTTGGLDRESQDVYVALVKAIDKGHPRLTGTTTLVIHVTDINDNYPMFSANTYRGSVMEMDVNSHILTVSATDGDIGTNSIITYSINSLYPGHAAASHFSIDSSSGILSVVTSVDRETDPTFIFHVLAVDGGTPSLTATATVMIDVKDVNEPPQWVATSTTVSMAEGLAVGTHVAKVVAVDRDSGIGGSVLYRIADITASNGTPSPGVFDVNTISGDIRTTRVLDCDVGVLSYTVTITATDGLGQTASPNFTLDISLTDVNDNSPVFGRIVYSFTIAENLVVGATVNGTTQVSASDADSGHNKIVKYKIDRFLEGESSHFSIDTDTGVITTASRLDRETNDRYVFVVVAQDTGVPPLTGSTTVTVTVTDVNDHAPQFSSAQYSGQVVEDAPIGTCILSLTVTDRDVSNSGTVTLFITTPQLAVETFSIESVSGRICLQKTVNREDHSVYTFTVRADDGGSLTSTTTVTVHVLDVNDNPPVMSPVFYNTEVAYTGVCDSSITTVTATDADSGINGDITYFLERNVFDYLFTIDPDSGVFSMKSRAGKSSRYILTASAQDGGTPANNASTPAIVRVDTLDLNDVAVTIRLSVDKAAFDANSAVFIPTVESFVKSSFPSAILKLWCVESRSGSVVIPTPSRRKLLQSSSPVDVHVYAVADNASDDMDNINKSKTFLTSAQLLLLLASDPSGTPVGQLTSGAMKYFHVEAVTEYHLVVTPWAETTAGIAIITVSVVLAVVLITVTVVVICYTYKRRKRPVSPQRPSHVYSYRRPKQKPRKGAELEIGYLKKHPPPVLMSLPLPTYTVKPLPMKTGEDGITSLDYTNNGGRAINRDFRGSAVDDATGRVYHYDTRKNQRRWMTTPEGKSVRVTHH
ncbi:cadherin-23-like [Haliotis cracherodii]|uniref:cadherin-23-like n=1 Tax=Haliotis cracherodii TaxID=6455 RepID=UPI0039E7FA15